MNYDQKMTALSARIKFDPNDAAALFEKGCLDYDAGHFFMASDTFSTILNREIGDMHRISNTHFMRARCYERLGKLDLAMEDLNWSIWGRFDPETTPPPKVAEIPFQQEFRLTMDFQLIVLSFFHRGRLLHKQRLYRRAVHDFRVVMLQGLATAPDVAVSAALHKGITSMLIDPTEKEDPGRRFVDACMDFSNAYSASPHMTQQALALKVRPNDGRFVYSKGQMMLVTLKPEKGFDVHDTVQPDYLGHDARFLSVLDKIQ